MKKIRPGFSARLAIVISVLLVSVNLLLGVVLVRASKSAMKTLIDSRMLDIANSAADLLDGDDLAALRKEDADTEAYRQINDTLAVFQENIDLKYIYCIRDLGDGRFVFSVDPTVEDPGEFGTPVVATEALISASRGTPAVDEIPYTDDWGRFYSAYSPVWDSQGNIAGIVAVDFSAEWYEAQIAKQTRAILLNSVVAVALGLALVLTATGRLRRQLRAVMEDVGEVVREVDDLTREINPDAPKKYSGDTPADDVRELGRRIGRIRDDLREYTTDLHSQANSMITALSSEYRSVYYVDLDKNEGICYQAHSQIDNGLKQGQHFAYLDTMEAYGEQYVTEPYREAFRSFLNPETVRRNLQNERIATLRYVIFRDGKESYEMIRMAGVRHPEDRDDHVVHAVGMGFTDVDAETRRTLSQSQVLKDALQAAEGANRAKTAFLSNMSHEIRTPMNAIIGLDRIALGDPGISQSTREHLEKIGTSAEHLLGIINDILDMSRIEAGRMILRSEAFSLRALLEQVGVMIGGQCREKGLIWSQELIGTSGEFYVGDDMKLKQVLLNILGNAVKFTPEGGSVRFTSERVAQYDGKSTFRFVMADTGIGISEEFLPRLFEPFSQEDLTTKTRYGSTGLGMSITKSIVEMMNGDIQVESRRGEGTTFTVTVTLTDSQETTGGDGTVLPREMHILVVDDDPVACQYAKLELEKAGAAVDTAASGAEAVELVRLKNARRMSYHLILVDWKMPEMDGLETARQIRGIIGIDSAIVILTAYHWDDILEDAQAAGVDSFLSKPLQADEVLEQFRQTFVLRAKHAGEKAELEGRRILVAEDVDVNAEILLMILQMRGMEADRAENGRAAVERFASQPEGWYDAVLMDMRMPEMDGLEATRAIRAMDRADARTVPIIALTANAFDEDVQRSLQAGLNAHLSKPVEPHDLYETLEGLIRP